MISDCPRDGAWHPLERVENYVHRADRAHALRLKVQREGLPIEIRNRKPWIELRWTATGDAP